MAIRFFNRIKREKMYWLLLWLLLFIWFLFCCSYLGEYTYRYPFVQSYRVLFLKTIPHILLPILPLIAALFCLKFSKKVLSLICGCVFIIVLPLIWLNITGELLYTPAVCSYTQDPKNYGQYDKEVQELVNLNGKGYLPEAIPSKAKNVRYHYLYEKASADTIFISVSWECSSDEMQQIQSMYATLSWEMYENGRKVVYLSEKILSENIQPYLHAVIMCDEINNVITHIVTNNKEFLPRSSSGKFVAPFFWGQTNY